MKGDLVWTVYVVAIENCNWIVCSAENQEDALEATRKELENDMCVKFVSKEENDREYREYRRSVKEINKIIKELEECDQSHVPSLERTYYMDQSTII